jgi:GTPase SAR1 family protein
MATLFVTLQGKGGVGKSFLTAAFAQWLVDRGRPVACIDTDTLNPTLLQYKPLKATHLKLSQNHVIDPRALDALVGIVTAAPEDAQVVVDVGSNGFETLMAYEVENGVFALLAELGHQVVVQTVIAGGPDAEETIKGTMALLAATDVPLILWLNEHLGPLEVHSQGRGRPITEAKFLHEARDRILGTILLPARTKATFGKDIEEMLRQRLTFGEAIAGFDLMPRTRIKRIRDELWAQLDALPLGEDQAQSRAAASA